MVEGSMVNVENIQICKLYLKSVWELFYNVNKREKRSMLGSFEIYPIA